MTMSFNRRLVVALVSGFVLGALWLVAIRFATFKDTRVHHHANFAVYVNGQKDEFKSSTFYEETAACSADEIGPRTRVHLHDQKPGVVHVHDEGSTWGHLFANLGYSLGNETLQTDAGVFIDGQDDNKLTFYLNGRQVDSLANEVIESEDAVLINYGNDSEDTLKQRYDEIVKDAAEYNQKNDPSACTGTKPLTFGERLRKAVGIGE
jgi:hypothetical protein